MISSIRSLALAALLLAPAAHAQGRSISDLQWLVGCWERVAQSGARSVEFWTAPANGVMMGGSYAVTDTSTREREQLRLWYAGDTLIYEAHPSSQAITLFKTTGRGPEFVFENPAHDFPQRIIYRRQGTDSLIARIEGDRAGRQAPITYPFKRTECRGIGPSASATARASLQPLYDEMMAGEMRQPGGRFAWVIERALPGYTITVWSAAGSTVTVLDAAALTRTVDAARRAPPTTMPIASSSATVLRVLARGDTMEVLVSAETKRVFTDEAGRIGAAGQKHDRITTQRWIDTWIRRGTDLRLRSTESISETVTMDGRPIIIDGRPIPPRQAPES